MIKGLVKISWYVFRIINFRWAANLQDSMAVKGYAETDEGKKDVQGSNINSDGTY